VLLTPHHGELAALTGGSKDAVAHRPAEAAARAADELSAIVVLKDRTTFIAEPGGSTVEYMNEAQGLGTAGSGDVLAGIIGGVLGRADDAKTAAAWGVWLHAMAGQSAARRIGPIGYMARDLAIELPSILNQMPQRT
jgi:NAD(P)H-hydrate repair Nnr-like enzyme with NAD(P)H-hydrate dehydratase domain